MIIAVLTTSLKVGGRRDWHAGDAQTRPASRLRIYRAPVPDPSAAMLAAVPAGGSPADGSRPAAIVVIPGDAKGDRRVRSPEVNVSVGWE